jgi:hypothetical protein
MKRKEKKKKGKERKGNKEKVVGTEPLWLALQGKL